MLAKFGDSITTDHISPAGSIGKETPAGKYLVDNGVQPETSTHMVPSWTPRGNDAWYICEHPYP